MSAEAELIARFLLAVDDHDWATVIACLDGTVQRDYSSLTGAAPGEIGGPELAAEWRGVLEGLTAHQHLLGPAVVDGAAASCQVIATHVLDGDPGSPWVVGGTYRFGLRRAEGGLRIAALRLDVRWQTGDPGLLGRAASG